MASAVFTHSFSSSDAISVTPEGEYAFEIRGHPRRAPAARISLATLELPLSQQPIEEPLSRICFSERLRVIEGRREVTLRRRNCGEASIESVSLQLPLYQTALSTLRVTSGPDADGVVAIEVTTKEPHQLWAAVEGLPRGCYAEVWKAFSDPIRLTGTDLGDVSFGATADFCFVDVCTFTVSKARCSLSEAPSRGRYGGHGYLHCPDLPGPLQLAHLIQIGLNACVSGGQYGVGVHAGHGGLALYPAAGFERACPKGGIWLEVTGDELACLCGLRGASTTWGDHQQLFLPSSTVSTTTLLDCYDARPFAMPTASLLAGTPWSAVGVGRLPTGFYDLSIRSSGATARHDFAKCWQRAMSPLYWPGIERQLPPVDAEERGVLGSQVLRFWDTSGAKRIVYIPAGSWEPVRLTDFLSHAMTTATANGSRITVDFVPDTKPPDEEPLGAFANAGAAVGRFRFQVDCGGGGCGGGGRFGLDFSSTMTTLEPEVLGFDRSVYRSGSGTLVSPHRVMVPLPNGASALPCACATAAAAAGVWDADVIGQQRRLRFDCGVGSEALLFVEARRNPCREGAPAALEVKARSYTPTGGRPWSHGATVGQLVQLRCRGVHEALPEKLLRHEGEGSHRWREVEVPSSSSPSPSLTLTLRVAEVGTGHDVDLLWLEVPSESVANLMVDGFWYLQPQSVYPSLYFGGKGVIRPSMLGLPSEKISRHGEVDFDALAKSPGLCQSALVWGSVGDLGGGGGVPRSWPLSAWATYHFDVPEIALVVFNERGTKGTTSLQHYAKEDVIMPLARINLGSLHREGGLRSETIVASAEPLTVFGLRILNPDGSIYKMHNANFTFSISVVVPLQ